MRDTTTPTYPWACEQCARLPRGQATPGPTATIGLPRTVSSRKVLQPGEEAGDPEARAASKVEKGEVGRGSKAKPGREGISLASGGCARRRARAPSAKRPVGYVPVSLSFWISGDSIGRTTARTPFLLFRPPAHPAPPRFSRAARLRPWPRLPRPSRHLALLTGLSPLHSGRSPSSHSATLPSCGCPGLRPRA